MTRTCTFSLCDAKSDEDEFESFLSGGSRKNA